MPRKPYTPEQRKAARKASRLKWEAKNPDKVQARYDRKRIKTDSPGFRTCAKCGESKDIEQYKKHGPRGHSRECLVCDPLSTEKPHRKVAGKKINLTDDEYSFRTCAECGTEKQLKYFAISRGYRLHRCKACCNSRSRKLEDGTAPKLSRTYVKKPDLPTVSWKQRLIQDGWRELGGESDPHEYITVFIRGFIVMYVRGATGTYSAGKCSYGILFDNSGQRFTQLGKAENRARRLYASAS